MFLEAVHFKGLVVPFHFFLSSHFCLPASLSPVSVVLNEPVLVGTLDRRVSFLSLFISFSPHFCFFSLLFSPFFLFSEETGCVGRHSRGDRGKERQLNSIRLYQIQTQRCKPRTEAISVQSTHCTGHALAHKLHWSCGFWHCGKTWTFWQNMCFHRDCFPQRSLFFLFFFALFFSEQCGNSTLLVALTSWLVVYSEA